jgi:hypothetical protein
MALEDLIENPGRDFGIDPDFWSNAYSWEPKKQHQFVMSIDDSIPAFLIKASAKPSISNGEITLDHINVQRYVKGKSVWNSIAVTLYDAIVPSGAEAVMRWIRLHHESLTGRDGYSSYYKKEIRLRQLDPLGEIKEEWILHGAFIVDSNFGSLDWSSEDVVNIEMALRYDYAVLDY